jgi:hypothetical protein
MGKGLRGVLSAGLLAILAPAMGGCSHAGSVSAAATDYNRAIARAHNEQILLNVLRASSREPLQFNAFSEIAVSVGRSIGIDTVASNLIAGGRDAISPTVRLGGSGGPIVRIAPLSSQAFTDGFLRPITPEVLNLFISQGWDGEFLLPLVVGSYTCNGVRFVNTGDGQGGVAVRDRLAAAGSTFQLRQERTPGAIMSLMVSSDRALDMLSRGVATDHVVLDVRPGSRPDTSVVRVQQPAETRWVASAARLCDRPDQSSASFDASGEASIQLRSPDGIIYFLGEAFRPCYLERRDGCDITYRKQDGILRYLFRIRSSSRPPQGSAIDVEMYGTRYWIPRLDSDDTDRTLKSVAFLNQLIALQTNPASLNTTPTLISLPPG